MQTISRFLRKSEKKLARLCRWHSRRKLGIRNRERMRLKVCLMYEKITNQRLDFLHKKSYQLAEDYNAVCIETLNMRAMSRTLKLGKLRLWRRCRVCQVNCVSSIYATRISLSASCSLGLLPAILLSAHFHHY